MLVSFMFVDSFYPRDASDEWVLVIIVCVCVCVCVCHTPVMYQNV